MTTDRIIFDGLDTFEGINQARVSLPWSGPWPPPDLLYLVAAAQEGITVVDPEQQSTGVIFRLITEHGAILFECTSASQVDRPAQPGDNWFRGALYQPRRIDEHP